MLRAALIALTFAILPTVALADRSEKLDTLFRALGLPEVLDVMHAEGIDYGVDMQDQMFPGRGGPSWSAVVEQIYDTSRMSRTVGEALERGLDDDDLDPLLDFFTSARGERIIGFEVSAREAMVDEAVEEAAEEALTEMRANEDPRLELIEEYVAANDLVASNVMGAMNANYAFYLGMVDAGALDRSMTESDILADVWAQEDEIRADTETWVYSYLAMAYQPLEDADLEAYVALSETEAGRALNRALFAGFDEMYVGISRALGLAAARFMTGEDI
ncbi:MAG: hypothetical protein AAGK37_01780 [Pseudomonadota bacterium]